jgi:hypothetical protein
MCYFLYEANMTSAATTITQCSASELATEATELGMLLHACVQDGASIGFVQPFTVSDGQAFWSASVLPALLAGQRSVLVARVGGRLAGSVQLDYDTAPNQAHRAEVRKLLVHPHYRRQGLARALMAELERHAAQLGRPLLTLDTRSGDTAEPLYLSLGYQSAGSIPGYARAPDQDRLDATSIMYKVLPGR